MKYACLIYADEGDPAASPEPGQPGFDEMMGAYAAFSEAVETAGVFVTGEPLHPTGLATSVRVRNGEVATTDGPFAETKEQLGGFYILECETLDDAIRWAAKIPHAATGTVEVRPIPDFS